MAVAYRRGDAPHIVRPTGLVPPVDGEQQPAAGPQDAAQLGERRSRSSGDSTTPSSARCSAATIFRCWPPHLPHGGCWCTAGCLLWLDAVACAVTASPRGAWPVQRDSTRPVVNGGGRGQGLDRGLRVGPRVASTGMCRSGDRRTRDPAQRWKPPSLMSCHAGSVESSSVNNDKDRRRFGASPPLGGLDRIDSQILAELQQDARLHNNTLAARVHLSASSCLARVR